MADCIPFLQQEKWLGLGGCEWVPLNIAIVIIIVLLLLILLARR